jgi:hypothetical protein
MLPVAAAVALAAATAIGGLASSAAPAAADILASTPIKYVTQSFYGSTAGVVTIGGVSCPSGSRVVSSGASAPGGVLIGISPDVNRHDSATASARLQGYLQVTVGCVPFAGTSDVVSKVIALPYKSSLGRGVLYCPAGMHAFGGGGFMMNPSGHISTDAYEMTSNAVSADGTGWTFAASTVGPNDRVVINVQCAPLRGSYVSQTGTPAPQFKLANVYGFCQPGYTALSGGVYLSKPDGNEVRSGYIDYSVPASGNRWYTDGMSFEDPTGDKLVALEQCIR